MSNDLYFRIVYVVYGTTMEKSFKNSKVTRYLILIEVRGLLYKQYWSSDDEYRIY